MGTRPVAWVCPGCESDREETGPFTDAITKPKFTDSGRLEVTIPAWVHFCMSSASACSLMPRPHALRCEFG